MVLDPLHANALTAKVLCCLERVPMPNIVLARWVCAMISRRICANALVNKPQMVDDPHLLVDLKDASRGVGEIAKGTIQFDGVVCAGCLAADVVVLCIRILTSVAKLLDGVILREEAKAERVCLPANQSVRVAALLAVFALHSESLGIQWWCYCRHVHFRRDSNDLARSHVDVLIHV